MKGGKIDLQQWLPVGILAIAGVLLYSGLTSKDEVGAKAEHKAKVQATVNKHLERTAEELEMQRRRAQIENARLALDYQNSAPGQAYKNPREGIDLERDLREERVAEDLGRGESSPDGPNNPMDLIHQQIFVDQKNHEADEAYKREYARQFIENARRGGYEVRLSEDYRVLSVKPIRRPTNQQKLFDGN